MADNDSRRSVGAEGLAATDIFEMWKQQYQDAQGTFKRFYDDAESAWSGVMQEAISSDPFARMMAFTREVFLTGIEIHRDSAQRTMETLQIPTTSDVARVAELVVGVEDKLQRMNDRLDEMTDLLRRVQDAAQKADEPRAGRAK